MAKTLEEAFEEFKKLPDWDRFPMPEVFYDHFKVKKPQAQNVSEIGCYQPPACLWLGDGKPEIREPAPGGVRQIEAPPPLPVEVLTDSEPIPAPPTLDGQDVLDKLPTVELKGQTVSDSLPSSAVETLSPPKEDTTTESQRE